VRKAVSPPLDLQATFAEHVHRLEALARQLAGATANAEAMAAAITHVAPVASIEPYGDSGKYKLIFSEPAKTIGPVPFGNAPSGTMQGPRYTTYERLQKAKTVSDLLGKI
jgi:hypothetical protein